MSTPTHADIYVQLNECLRKAQEHAATLAHLCNTSSSDKDKAQAKGWLMVSETFRLIQFRVNLLAQGKLQ